MNSLALVLAYTAETLRKENLPFALIGGLAVSVRSEPRFTRDIDLAIVVAPEEIDKLGRHLQGAGFVIVSVLSEATTDLVTGLRLERDGVRVDLLMHFIGLESEACATAELLEVFSGTTVPVARLPLLVVFKLVAAQRRKRRQDLADIELLLFYATSDDRQEIDRLIQRAEGTHTGDASELRAILATFT